MIKYNPVALKPVDYATPLKNVYAEQSAALDRHHALLRERDEQEEEATLNLPEIFSKLSAFSQSIQSAVKSQKAGKTEKTEKTRWETKKRRSEAGVDENQIDTQYTHINETEDLKNDLEKLKEYLKAEVDAGRLGEKEAAYIESSHGGTFVHEMELIAHNKAKYIVSDMTSDMDDKSDPNNPWKGANLQYKWNQTEDDPKARRALAEKYAFNQFEKLGIESDYIYENYWPQVEKQLNTKGILEKVKYEKTLLTQKSIKQNSELEVALGRSATDPSAGAKAIQRHILNGVSKKDGITLEKSKDNYALRLERLAITQELTQDEFNLLKAAAIKHPAGKAGEVLLTDKHWQQIQNGITQASIAAVKKKTAGIVANAKIVENQIIAGNGTVEELQQLKDATLLQLSRTVGKDDEAYKDLESWDVEAQIAGSYEKSKLDYAEYYNGNDLGLLLQNEDSFKLEPNGRVRAELAKMVAEAKKTLRDAGLPDTWDKYQRSVKDTMITSSAMKKTIKREDAFSDNQKRVQNLIANNQLKTLMTTVRNGGTIEDGKKIHAAWLEENGYNVVDEANPKGVVGILSPTIKGEYKHFSFVNPAKIENRAKPSLYNLNTWSTKTGQVVYDYKGDINEAFKNPESFIDKEDVLGAFIEKTNEQGKIELFYSPELLVKSMTLGMQPSDVLKKSMEALINGGEEYKDYVERFDLKGKLELLKDAPDLKLKQILEETGDKDLISAYNRAGGFTPNQMTRMLNFKVNELNTEFANKEKKANLVSKAKKKQKLDNRIIQNTEAREEADQTGQGTQEYFRGTDDRTDEELDEQFNAQTELF